MDLILLSDFLYKSNMFPILKRRNTGFGRLIVWSVGNRKRRNAVLERDWRKSVFLS